MTETGSRSFFVAAPKIIDPNRRWLSNRLLYIDFRIFRGTSLLQVDKAYSAEFSLALSLSIWPEKDNWSSIQIPRNRTVFSGHVWPTRVIVLLPIYRGLTWVWLFGFLNKMNLDFLAFIVNLLQLNHCSATRIYLFACFTRLKESEPDIWKV